MTNSPTCQPDIATNMAFGQQMRPVRMYRADRQTKLGCDLRNRHVPADQDQNVKLSFGQINIKNEMFIIPQVIRSEFVAPSEG